MLKFGKNIPPPIVLNESIFSVDLHPQKDIIALGKVNGHIELHQYIPNGKNLELANMGHSDEACRCVKFSKTGSVLYSCYSDSSMCGFDMETKKKVFEKENAHKSPINSMIIHEKLIITGDDNGVIKIWDQRKSKKVTEIAENTDFISSFTVNSKENILLAASGDETLSIIDIRKMSLIDQYDTHGDEFSCMDILKNGNRVACGGQSGYISVFHWGEWIDHSSKFKFGGDSIDCMIAFDQNTVITGSSDGGLRMVTIEPNALLQFIDYTKKGLGISSVTLSFDKNYLASCNDTSIKFYNLSKAFESNDQSEDKIHNPLESDEVGEYESSEEEEFDESYSDYCTT